MAAQPKAVIARKHGVHVSTIRRRAIAENWTKQSVEDDPHASSAAHLYQELSTALRMGLARLDPSMSDAETLVTAQERAQLIRAHRRALIALVEAERGIARLSAQSSGHSKSPRGVSLDLDAARAEVLSRLDRLANHCPQP